jgi:hypothetical protein
MSTLLEQVRAFHPQRSPGEELAMNPAKHVQQFEVG